MKMPTALSEWRARGQFLRLLGRTVFVVDAGPRDAEPLLILHGFPSSSFDFHLALPRLAEKHRVIMHDHIGFGFSDKPDNYSYSLVEQADMAVMVWQALGLSRGHLLAHDYGTSVATELCARRERGLLSVDLLSLTLTNGSMHRELAHLQPSQKILLHKNFGPVFARLANRFIFRLQIRRILGSGGSVSDDELDAMWAGIQHAGGNLRLPEISVYLDERIRFRERWIGALTRWSRPAHVVWGQQDPIAVPLMAETITAEIPTAKLTWLSDLGHYPMLERPSEWAEITAGFLERLPKTA
ncbi:MAG: alpha/beta hydrolase [Polyangiaceae bacterium]|nr:alpha/beta hydrolase [Polyangiaceae bacterium]